MRIDPETGLPLYLPDNAFSFAFPVTGALASGGTAMGRQFMEELAQQKVPKKLTGSAKWLELVKKVLASPKDTHLRILRRGALAAPIGAAMGLATGHIIDATRAAGRKNLARKLEESGVVLDPERMELMSEKLSTDGKGNVSDTALRTSTRPGENSPLFSQVRTTTARSLPETKPISDGSEDFLGVTKISSRWAKLLAKRAEEIAGGLADGKSDAEYPKDELRKGIEVEKEHTDDPEKAKEIAKDHLEEHPTYYEALAKMEKKLEDKEAELDPAFAGGFKETINANMQGPKLSPRDSDKTLAQKVAEKLLEKKADENRTLGIPNPIVLGGLGGLAGVGITGYQGAQDWRKYLQGKETREKMWESMRKKNLTPSKFGPAEKALFTKYQKHVKGLRGPMGGNALLGAGLGLGAGLLFS